MSFLTKRIKTKQKNRNENGKKKNRIQKNGKQVKKKSEINPKALQRHIKKTHNKSNNGMGG